MTGHILPESTNACPTSPTTDIQPELLNEAREFFAVECEKHGFSSQAVAVRSGDISHADGGQVCIDAMLAFARHRLTSTTPILGDMVMVPSDLRALSERATPGPWAWEQCGDKEDVPVIGIAFSGDDPDCKAPYEGEFRDSDANRMTIAYDWQSCDGHSPSSNAAFAVAAVNFVRTMIAAAPASPIPTSVANEGRDSFQQRVQPWLMACFGEIIAGDRAERNHRFLEEALELVQSCGCTSHEAHQLVDYVYGRDVGDPPQEVGGVMVTLAALCLANGLDMHANGETELARIWTKVEAIRAKQAAKPKHSPLPAALSPALDNTAVEGRDERAGWIVGNNAGQWRTFDSFGWAWTDRRDLAVRYARRADAELVHGEDEDSWRVERYSAALTAKTEKVK